jgi:hypothetical protein
MVVVLTSEEMLRKGLELVGFEFDRQLKVKSEQNNTRFKAHYGSNPIVYAQIWEDFQTTEIPEARIGPKMMDVDAFLMGIHFLKCYPSECERAGLFKICEKSARKWCWYYASKIQALKREKVSYL